MPLYATIKDLLAGSASIFLTLFACQDDSLVPYPFSRETDNKTPTKDVSLAARQCHSVVFV